MVCWERSFDQRGRTGGGEINAVSTNLVGHRSYGAVRLGAETRGFNQRGGPPGEDG